MTSNQTILIVEDEQAQRDLLRGFLESNGYSVRVADSVAAARAALDDAVPSLLMTDYNLPDGNGIEVLEHARACDEDIAAVVVTAYGTVSMAVEAMRSGAFDVQLKPVDPKVLLQVVKRALRGRALVAENESLRERLSERFDVPNIVAQSDAMQEVLRIATRIAPTKATVLITGESGTGKELIANLLHERSSVSQGPFVAVHCAALSADLLESELFGHAQGAFTGATSDRIGRFEHADGGTIFLDELGEISLDVQVRLLRVLQEHKIVRVGENDVRPVNVRVLAATNRDLEAEVAAGRFREDLFYRLNVVRIHLPPLRERPEDIAILAQRFLANAAVRHDCDAIPFSPAALERLSGHALPGNVRQLQNEVERALLLARGDALAPDDFSLRSPIAPDAEPATLDEAIEALERRWIVRALKDAGGVQTRAARALGVDERVLRYKMKKYGIQRPG